MCISIENFSQLNQNQVFFTCNLLGPIFKENINLLLNSWLLFPIFLTKLFYHTDKWLYWSGHVAYLNKLHKLNMFASFSHSYYSTMCWWKYLNVSYHLHYHFDWTGEESTGKNEPNTLVDRNHECLAGCCKCYIPWLRLQNLVFILVSDPLFDLFITLCILVNTIFMGIEYHNMPQGLVDATTWANFVCQN